MGSYSSIGAIKARSIDFFEKKLTLPRVSGSDLDLICQFLNLEYDSIPENEKVGKGMVYIVKAVSRAFVNVIKEKINDRTKRHGFLINIIESEPEERPLLMFTVLLAAHVALEDFTIVEDFVVKWAQAEEWDMRELACHPVIFGLKKQTETTLKFIEKNVGSGNENIRRMCAESLRPKAEIRWLRDPNDARNDLALSLLTELNHDPSIYVRKAVGNNVKDLSKYMPEKVLELVESWLKDGESLGEKEHKYLLWTIYQGLRWLKDKEPRFHPALEKLVGKNYILYFNEKSNRWAVPRDKKEKI